MSSEVVELRYSLNGISESQLLVLFSQIESEQRQIIIKRISNPSYSLSTDDIILEGFFSKKFLSSLSQVFPPPLSCKIKVNNFDKQIISKYSSIDWVDQNKYSSIEWVGQNILYAGITLLPTSQMQQMIGFSSNQQFFNLITTTRVGSVLKCLLLAKPKGLIAIQANIINIILPLHRVEFVLAWIDEIQKNTVTLDWLSGSTGDLSEELVSTIGSIDQSQFENLDQWLQQTNDNILGDFKGIFNRALIGLKQL